MKKLNFMNGVIGGVTQASHVSSFVGSSLNFDLDENTNKRWKHEIINKHFLLGFSFTWAKDPNSALDLSFED